MIDKSRLKFLAIPLVAFLFLGAITQTDWVTQIKRGPMFDIRTYGAKVDGTTDDTTALRNAIAAAYAAGGGTVFVPAAINCARINGQITMPNDGASPIPGQKTIRIIGNGDATNGLIGVQAVTSGSCLDMRFSGSTGKLLTFGAGKLEIAYLNITDGSTGNTTPFIYDTNTVLNIHDISIIGSVSGPTTTQDAIILGGTTTVRSGTSTAPFGGYGSRFTGILFNRLRRALYGRVHSNGVMFYANTIGQAGGGAAAIEFNGNAGAGDRVDGGYIAGNIIELNGYTAGIKLDYSNNFDLIANMLFDFDGFSTYGIVLGTNTQYNFVIPGTYTGGVGSAPYFTDLSGNNNVITRDQAVGGYTAIMPFVSFASLPSPVPAKPGAQVFCVNCTTASPCASGGSGHVATSNGTIWKCD